MDRERDIQGITEDRREGGVQRRIATAPWGEMNGDLDLRSKTIRRRHRILSLTTPATARRFSRPAQSHSHPRPRMLHSCSTAESTVDERLPLNRRTLLLFPFSLGHHRRNPLRTAVYARRCESRCLFHGESTRQSPTGCGIPILAPARGRPKGWPWLSRDTRSVLENEIRRGAETIKRVTDRSRRSLREQFY